MKEFTETQIQDIFKLKFGSLVDEHGHTSFVSNQVLGKLFSHYGSKIRSFYMARFEEVKSRKLSLLE